MKIGASCLKDKALISLIELIGEKDVCDLTGKEEKVVDTEADLSDTFQTFVECFKEDAHGDPLLSKIQTDWHVFADDLAEPILKEILKETISSLSLDTKVVYSNKVVECIGIWDILKEEIIKKFRFLSIKDMTYEDYLLRSFDVHRREFSHLRLFRSRINEDGSVLPKDANKMGAPPAKLASGGRANPEGIPYLYLSNTPETTFYEVRAVYLDNISTALFECTDELTLIDFSTIDSPFNDIYESVENGIIGELLVRKISEDLSRPMRRSDSPLEYIPTQFICEYIKYQTDADGIVFNSSLHKDGVNYVIFNPSKFTCKEVTVHSIGSVEIKEH